ncbi:MAG: PqqD family protein [Candidatus Riflebacteria bacterium]
MNRLLSLAMNETGFAFDPSAGESYTINHTAREIIELIKRGMEVEDIAKKISSEYEMPFEEVYTDTIELIEKLRAYGFI